MKITTHDGRVAERFRAMSNAEMLSSIRHNRPDMGDYAELLALVDEKTADRLSYAMALTRCEVNGDSNYTFAPDPPRVWREHN